MRSALRATVFLVLPTLVACLAMLEVGLRVLGRLPSNTTDGVFEAYPSSYRLKRSSTKVSRTPSFTCTIHTNDFGLRDRLPGRRSLGPAPYDAFLGDSLTFGNGVDYDDTFVGRYAQLAARQGVDVLNLAVGGHTLRDQEGVLQDFLREAPVPPARVVVTLTAPMVALFDAPKSDVVVKNGYLFRRGSWLVPYTTVMLGNASAAYCFFRDGIRKLQARFFPTGPRAERELMEIFSVSAPATTPEVAERIDAALSRVDGEIRGTGALPIYVYLPTAADLRSDEFLGSIGARPEQYDFHLYERIVREHCARAGIPFVSLMGVMERERAKGKRLNFAQDMHYNASANQVLGEALGEALLGGGLRASTSGPR